MYVCSALEYIYLYRYINVIHKKKEKKEEKWSLYAHLPLRHVTFVVSIMLIVTAGFMWAPPISPKTSMSTVTTKPIPKATWTTLPNCKVVSLHVSGKAHWTATRKNVASPSAITSLQNSAVFTSFFMRSVYACNPAILMLTVSLISFKQWSWRVKLPP